MPDETRPATSAETFQQFVAAINGHDVDALRALMTADHLFVDSMSNRVQGATSMERGWRAYFTMCSDYWVRIDTSICEGDKVLAVGEAGGTIDNIAWRTPAAWLAVIRSDLVSEWRVFADNKPVYEILARRRS
jgi:ketosteroid isomerase-like protein